MVDPSDEAPDAAKPGDDDTIRAMPANMRVFNSVEIFAAAQEVIIEHEGALYRLRKTRKRKLILIK